MSDLYALRARIIGTLLAIFTFAFLALPMVFGGHPGEPVAVAAASYHLT